MSVMAIGGMAPSPNALGFTSEVFSVSINQKNWVTVHYCVSVDDKKNNKI